MTTPRRRAVALAVVIILILGAGGADFVRSSLAAKSAPDYTLFAEGLLYRAIRIVTATDTALTEISTESRGAPPDCNRPVPTTTTDTAIGLVSRSSSHRYLPFMGNTIEVVFALPSSGYSRDIYDQMARSLEGTGDPGDAKMFVKGLRNGSNPTLNLVQCGSFDLLSLAKRY